MSRQNSLRVTDKHHGFSANIEFKPTFRNLPELHAADQADVMLIPVIVRFIRILNSAEVAYGLYRICPFIHAENLLLAILSGHHVPFVNPF